MLLVYADSVRQSSLILVVYLYLLERNIYVHRTEQNRTEYNYGISLLKIVAMYMIVILHTLGQGGILSNTTPEPQNIFSHYSIAWFLEIFAYCSTNCYAMISGYLSWKRKIDFYKLVIYWLQIVFYTLSITTLFYYFSSFNITIEHWKKALLPIITRQYWYMTDFFILFLFMPIINIYIQLSSKKSLKKLSVILMVLVSIAPILAELDPFQIHYGYSALWLITMYFIGAVISKCNLLNLFNKRKLLMFYLFLIIFTWNNNVIHLFNALQINANLIDYTSPTIIASSAVLIIIFSKIKIKNEWVLSRVLILSNATLGVYLIHVNPLIWDNFILGYAIYLKNYSVPIMVVGVLLYSAAIYIACSMIEIFRQKLFRLLNIHVKVKKLCTLI